MTTRGGSGASDQTRTGTLFPTRDFKSLVSANSTTEAYINKAVLTHLTTSV